MFEGMVQLTASADEVPLARFALEGRRVHLRIESESGILHNGRQIVPGATVTITGSDELTVPGDRGEPSCRLRLTQPRREDA